MLSTSKSKISTFCSLSSSKYLFSAQTREEIIAFFQRDCIVLSANNSLRVELALTKIELFFLKYFLKEIFFIVSKKLSKSITFSFSSSKI